MNQRAQIVLDYQDPRPRPPTLVGSCASALLCGAILFLAIVLALAGASWAGVLFSLLTDGLLVVGWFAAAGGIGWMILRRARLLAEVPALLRIVTFTASGLGAMSLLLLALSLAGWLNRYSTLAILLAGLICVLAALYGIRKHTINWRAPARWGWAWLITVPMFSIAVISALVPPGVLWSDDPTGYDVVEYHLQVPREWYEAGRMMPLSHNVFSYFPFNVEMHYLAAMELHGGPRGPWAGMYAAQFMHLGFVTLSVLAVAGVAGALAASDVTGDETRGKTDDFKGSHAAVLAGVAAASAPWLTMLGAVAYDEGGLLLFGTLAIGWAVTTMRGEAAYGLAGRQPWFLGLLSGKRYQCMVLCGAMTGLACGSKLTAVPILLIGIPLALFAVLLLCRLRRATQWVAPLSVFLAAAAILFAPWLIRTAVWAGNPVFPELPQIGHGPFTRVQTQRWAMAHSPTPPERPLARRVARAWQEIAADWRYALVLFPLAAVAVITSLWLPQCRCLGNPKSKIQNPKSEPNQLGRAPAIFLACLLLILLVFWLGFTHLQSRFFVLGIPLAALCIAQVRWSAWPVLALSVLSIGIATVTLPHLMRLEQGPFRTAGFARNGLLGIDDLSVLRNPALPPLDQIQRLRLIGDAKAFIYQVPMSRLTYRTVFDVNAEPGASDVEAWLAASPPRTGDVLLIDYNELRRFSRTYFAIPPPPDDKRGVEILRR